MSEIFYGAIRATLFGLTVAAMALLAVAGVIINWVKPTPSPEKEDAA